MQNVWQRVDKKLKNKSDVDSVGKVIKTKK